MPWSAAWVSVVSRLVHVAATVPPAERRPEQAIEAFAEFALDPTTGGYLPGKVEVAGPRVAAERPDRKETVRCSSTSGSWGAPRRGSPRPGADSHRDDRG